MKKTITVAIPVFNGEDFLEEAIQSIVEQTQKVDTILICDNQSTDNTVNIVKQQINKYPALNIKLHQNEVNIGCDPNFNKCMELCSTDYLILLGSDDKLKPETVEKQVSFLNKHSDIGLVGGYTNLIDEKGSLIYKFKGGESKIYNKGEILEYIKETNMFLQHSTVMYNTKYSKQIGYWDDRYIAADERYYVKILTQFPIARIGEALVDQRIHKGQEYRDENTRFNEKIQHFTENLKIANFETDSKRIKESKKLIQKLISNQCLAISKIELKDGKNITLSARYWFYGFKKNPKYFLYIYSRKAKHGFQKLFGIKY